MSFVPGSAARLAALCSSRVLSATWFVAYSAVLPLTQLAWGLSGREAGMIQAAFHLGYLTSLFIIGFVFTAGFALMEATLALDMALKTAHVRAAKIFPPPSETNFASAWLTGPLEACEAAALAYCETVVRVAANPRGEVWGT